jgi:hypothetical protein
MVSHPPDHGLLERLLLDTNLTAFNNIVGYLSNDAICKALHRSRSLEDCSLKRIYELTIPLHRYVAHRLPRARHDERSVRILPRDYIRHNCGSQLLPPGMEDPSRCYQSCEAWETLPKCEIRLVLAQGGRHETHL